MEVSFELANLCSQYPVTSCTGPQHAERHKDKDRPGVSSLCDTEACVAGESCELPVQDEEVRELASAR
jgi:hypothetical protein